MEALYSKLYDKYTKLKAKKASEIEQISLDQEEKFKTYVSAADELIGYLTSEKDRLYAQINELRQEIVSIRSAKDEEQQQYEIMLIEEKQKNKQLSEEMERLQRREPDSIPKQLSGSPFTANNSTKRKRLVMDEKEVVDEDIIFSGVFNNEATQPKCCRPRLGGTVNAASDSSNNCCMFQELVECLFDLKFSIEIPSDDNIQLAAFHESSGYSFSLGWVKKGRPGEEETMMMYRVSSLGTFERVAPEWMRDVMLFSKSMSSVFFKRLSVYFKSS
ncbi:hypothetical protein R6Q57_009033 [Mikania cordata]